MAGLLALFAFLALVVFAVGVVALARSHLDWARIRSRGRAGVVTAVAFVLFVAFAALIPDDTAPAAVSASPLPSAASPSLQPTPTPNASSPATSTQAIASRVAWDPASPPATATTTAAATTTTAAATTATAAAVATSLRPRPASPVAQAPVGELRTSAAPVTIAPAAVPPPPPPPPPAPPANPRAGCNPSYPDVCLRDGIGDYDCEGGSGNGPNYVRGPLRVLQPDPFDLDHDGNGTGCQS